MELGGFTDVSAILRGGVYALCWQGKVVYVGQSKGMLARVYTHKSQRGRSAPAWLPVKGVLYDEVQVIPCPDPTQRSLLEREMIDRYRPRHNILHVPSGPIRAPIAIKVNGVELNLNAKSERRV